MLWSLWVCLVITKRYKLKAAQENGMLDHVKEKTETSAFISPRTNTLPLVCFTMMCDGTYRVFPGSFGVRICFEGQTFRHRLQKRLTVASCLSNVSQTAKTQHSPKALTHRSDVPCVPHHCHGLWDSSGPVSIWMHIVTKPILGELTADSPLPLVTSLLLGCGDTSCSWIIF